MLKAQIPLKIDPNDSPYYIPDPLFIYANLNEINVQLIEPLLNWINYAPEKRDNSEMLNLLVLEMFEDITDPESLNNEEQTRPTVASFRSSSTRIVEYNIESASSSSINLKQRSILAKQRAASVVKGQQHHGY